MSNCQSLSSDSTSLLMRNVSSTELMDSSSLNSSLLYVSSFRCSLLSSLELTACTPQYTNRRTDDYGGTPEKRLFFLQRIVREVRAACPAPYILSVKLNSGDCE